MGDILKNELIELFNEYQDLSYKKFISKLIPNISSDTIIGVKIPIIRKIYLKNAKEKKYDFFTFELPHFFLEENLFHACFLSKIKDYDKLIFELNRFLPYIDNWLVCDIIKPCIIKENLDIFLVEIKRWLKSANTYEVRFAVVMLLNYYLDDSKYIDEINYLLVNLKTDEYYINMAISWYFSYALIKQYNKTIYIFENHLLDKWINNKSIQKAIDSKRISDNTKIYLKTLKF